MDKAQNIDQKAAASAKSPHAEREERILAKWQKEGTFKKSLEKPAGRAPKGKYTFYDGPPFATGTPHYGHILAGTIKDVIPRWKTMQGFHVRRRWGWDCHGLPVENLIEKELGLATKKDIVTYGVGKFNDAAKASVMRYADEWRRIVPRLGRWVDMDDDYRTMDATYTETVWWIFKNLFDKGLIYEGFKSMNLCPRCETTLSNFEVAQGYKDITDLSVTAKFELADEPGTFVLAWTTTPWTLPGNVALAVNPDIEYVKVSMEGGAFILAKARAAAVLKDAQHTILESMPGSKLVGRSYKPLFEYYASDAKLKNRENGWKIYGADFVTTEDGTGVVHIAPAFGADDYELLKKYELPFVQHVSTDGHFKPEVKDFAGMAVKPIDTAAEKDAHMRADIEIVKWLAHHGQLFAKEKLVHSYPHCWRCETPLLNYAASSWFVRVADFKDKLVAANKDVAWVPSEIGEGRFGNWLAGARDWAISRTRFWGAPIPVWKDERTGECHVMGSRDDLKKFSKAKNTYYVMRHGEAVNNVDGILSGDPKKPHHLTEKGKVQVKEGARQVKKINPDLIIVSPFVRTQETAEIVRAEIGMPKEKVVTDERIRELGSGSWDGKKVSEYFEHFAHVGRFDSHPDGVENYAEIKTRMGDFLYDLETKHEGKTILIITHETPAHLLISAALGLTREEALALRGPEEFIRNAEVRRLDFSPLPHNAEYEIEFHRPFIDDIELRTPEGNKLVRVPDVFDCWFESGSMPYGEAHYPFIGGKGRDGFSPASTGLKGLLAKSRGFPADFIAEGLDQTRGWFYSMMVLGVALFGRSPYKKVIVNGLVLAEDGEKMSKSKKNYPDPMLLVEKYGADALRYYLLSSPVVRGQDLRFSEKGVDEITKKLVNRLLNVVSFYEMYVEQEASSAPSTRHPEPSSVLDRWVIARLDETIAAVTDALEKGELDRATWPFMDFVDDLSTWYLRRSRDRFKGDDAADKASALGTTRFALLEFSKLLAPFMPFLAEDIYGRMSGVAESVHLDAWPTGGSADAKLIASMKIARDLASRGLEARMAAKINVRQPLQRLIAHSSKLKGLGAEFVGLIKDEVNVKEVVSGGAEAGITDEQVVALDTKITPELKEEGDLRELIRAVQDLRKEKGFSVGEAAALTVPADRFALAQKYADALKKAASLSSISEGAALEVKK